MGQTLSEPVVEKVRAPRCCFPAPAPAAFLSSSPRRVPADGADARLSRRNQTAAMASHSSSARRRCRAGGLAWRTPMPVSSI